MVAWTFSINVGNKTQRHSKISHRHNNIIMPRAYYFEGQRHVCGSDRQSLLIVSEIPRPPLEVTPVENLVFSFHYHTVHELRFDITAEEYKAYDEITKPPLFRTHYTRVTADAIEVYHKDSGEVLLSMGKRTDPAECEAFTTGPLRVAMCSESGCTCKWGAGYAQFEEMEKVKSEAFSEAGAAKIQNLVQNMWGSAV